MQHLPLAGLKVVDLCTVLMGPLCTQIMADHGAEILKVEPVSGDTTRWIGPSVTEGMGPLFLNLNRGKQSLAMDLGDAGCRQALSRLIAGADVVIHNIRPQVARRRGLDFDSIARLNPKVVFCNLYGYGQAGPYGARPAYDDLIQGACGIPHLQQRAGLSEPRYAPVNLADRTVGVYAAAAVSMGLLAVARTGQAQQIEIPMYEVLTSMVLGDHMYGAASAAGDGTTGYPRLLSEHRKPYRTKDGYICLAVYNDSHWRRFLPAIGREDLLHDPRFASLNARMRHIGFVSEFVLGVLADRTTADWMAFFDALDIPVAPMNSVEDLLSDPQTAASQLVVTQQHPTEGTIKAVASPLLWGGARSDPGHAPKLGEHSRQALTAAGCDAAEIADLIAKGAVRSSL